MTAVINAVLPVFALSTVMSVATVSGLVVWIGG